MIFECISDDIPYIWRYTSPNENFLWKVSLKIPNSEFILKTLTHEIIIWQFPYQTLYQPETPISAHRLKAWGLIWVKGWYRTRYENCHIINYLAYYKNLSWMWGWDRKILLSDDKRWSWGTDFSIPSWHKLWILSFLFFLLARLHANHLILYWKTSKNPDYAEMPHTSDMVPSLSSQIDMWPVCGC